MEINVGDYIETNNDSEWVFIQKYLFSLGYSWCNNSREIIETCNYPYPDYILLESNHLQKGYGTHRMFSYSHIPYDDSIIHKSTTIKMMMREKKLKRIIK